jgi:hypothetical protein
VKRTKYINWILGFRQTTFVALFYYQVYEKSFIQKRRRILTVLTPMKYV